MAPASAQDILQALQRLPGRDHQRLAFLLVEGRTPNECAALYGTGAEPFGVALLRSARLFQAALAQGRAVLPTDVPALLPEDEAREAQALWAALESGTGHGELEAALLSARAQGAEVKRLFVEQERAYLASPAAKRSDLLRRLALVALLALAVWLLRRGSP